MSLNQVLLQDARGSNIWGAVMEMQIQRPPHPPNDRRRYAWQPAKCYLIPYTFIHSTAVVSRDARCCQKLETVWNRNKCVLLLQMDSFSLAAQQFFKTNCASKNFSTSLCSFWWVMQYKASLSLSLLWHLLHHVLRNQFLQWKCFTQPEYSKRSFNPPAAYFLLAKKESRLMEIQCLTFFFSFFF